MTKQSFITVKGSSTNLVVSFDTLWSVLRVLTWLFGVPKIPSREFLMRIRKLWRTNGKTFTVMYLKECVRIFQHYLSGNLVSCSQDIPVRIIGGLPSIIPGHFRSLIRDGNTNMIRFTYTILSLYRIIKIPGKLKLNTITDPFKGRCSTLPQLDIANGLKGMLMFASVTSWKLDTSKEGFLDLVKSGASGPNEPSSLLGIFKDIVAFERNPIVKGALMDFGKHIPNASVWLDYIFQDTSSLVNSITDEVYLGRLSIKEEAAGKLRVFAITDAVTQTVLRPLHKALFKILKQIPMDGTFNQGKPLLRLKDLYQEGLLKGNSFHSFDLSAATDRLPIDLQSDIISMLYQNEDMGKSWAKLLTSRDWVLLRGPGIESPVHLKYAVGQPMGALSSWAMLALTHHLIVQVAAIRVGIYKFSHYALLGDDIVIANDKVADEYHKLMTLELGVDINLHKSLKSVHTFEFAKRLVNVDCEFSCVSPMNALISLKSMRGIPALLLDAHLKGFAFTEEHIDDLFKTIPTLSKRAKEEVLWVIKGPFGFVPSADGLTASMKLVNSLSAVRMNSLIDSIDQALFERDRDEFYSNVKRSSQALLDLENYQPPLGGEAIKALIQTSMKLEYDDLLSKAPVRKFIFDGPILFFNFYREGWMKEMMAYITKKIHSYNISSTSLLNPFDSEIIRLPSLSHKGTSFFKRVREYDKEKDLLRGTVWF